MNRFLLLALVVFLSIPCLASSAAMDGNQFLTKCKPFYADLSKAEIEATPEDERLDTMYCLGYVTGILDVELTMKAVDEQKSLTHFCTPSGVTTGQIFKIVKKWLDDNPDKLHWRLDLIIHVALREAFPCSETGVKKPGAQ